MIVLDRASTVPVHEQLVEQLRYLIASGHFALDAILPSTRVLGEQVGVSFHTVRKAYQQLEREGLVAARVGQGYRVIERAPLSKTERIERGAAVVQEALQRLIGLGLEEGEVEYLLQEQFDQIGGRQAQAKLVFAAPYREMATLCADQIGRRLQQPVEAATLRDLQAHQDADYVFGPFRDLHVLMNALPRADVLGVAVGLDPEALGRVARLLPHQTLGLITHYADAIGPLTTELRAQTGFAGQMLAAALETGAHHLTPILDQTDLVLFTPPCRRRLRPLLGDTRPHLALTPAVSTASLDAIREAVPS